MTKITMKLKILVVIFSILLGLSLMIVQADGVGIMNKVHALKDADGNITKDATYLIFALMLSVVALIASVVILIMIFKKKNINIYSFIVMPFIFLLISFLLPFNNQVLFYNNYVASGYGTIGPDGKHGIWPEDAVYFAKMLIRSSAVFGTFVGGMLLTLSSISVLQFIKTK